MAHEKPPTMAKKDPAKVYIGVPKTGDPSQDEAHIQRYADLGYEVIGEERGRVNMSAPRSVAERIEKEQISRHLEMVNAGLQKTTGISAVTNEFIKDQLTVQELLGDDTI